MDSTSADDMRTQRARSSGCVLAELTSLFQQCDAACLVLNNFDIHCFAFNIDLQP